jgi:ribose transport system ATP-binding protein
VSTEPNDTAVPLLELERVGKSYGGIPVLEDVSFAVGPGETVGLVGENGAGKSTLLRCITGLTPPDTGGVRVRGEAVSFPSYHDANDAGVFQVFQELSFVPNLSVGENFFLSHERRVTRSRWRSRRAVIRRANEILAEHGYGWIDAARPASDFDVATRQLLEILKAFALTESGDGQMPIILLDEPTASLSNDEVQLLYGLLERVRKQVGIVLVTHRLSEVIELSDRLVVLKDGELVADVATGDMTEAGLHELMVGRKRDQHFYQEHRQGDGAGDEVLRLDGVTVDGHFRDVSLSVARGEIVGIGGVMGSGKSELGRAVFGDLRITGGSVAIKGEPVGTPSVRGMVGRRVGYLSPDRADEGLLTGLSVAANLTIAGLGRQSPVLNRRGERRDAERFIEQLRIRTRGAGQSVETLSGGNQQKVLLARWLWCGVDALILDNPTRGVDAGAKEEIYRALRDLADAGVALLVISDDLLELIGLSNRILVMKDGAVQSELDSPTHAKPSERDVVAEMV